ncbi:MAG: 6-phosphogluconate dehydrogenase [Flavobacteriaceae bacterium]
MRKFLVRFLIILTVIGAGYFCFIYFVPYSEGIRAGELIKFSKKGFIIKTWEGQLSQGVSDEQQFQFSVEDKDKAIIADLEKYQGRFVKLTYFERYRGFFWLGDTKYFVTKVEEDKERQSFTR